MEVLAQIENIQFAVSARGKYYHVNFETERAIEAFHPLSIVKSGYWKDPNPTLEDMIRIGELIEREEG